MLLFLLSLSQDASAVPLQLTQQGRMIDSNGSPVAGAEIVTFRIYDDLTAGNLLWTEGLTVNFTNGYYATVLGADTVTNPLDSDVLSLYPIYLEVQLGANSPMSPRTAMNSAPYAQIAGIAESVEGGTVDASELSINGNVVIDGNGVWVGQALTVDWSNLQGIPSDIADGDDNTQLSESQVEGYINNGAIDLHPSTTMNGSGLLTQADTLTPDWSNITNRPAGLDDGDDDALSGLGCAQGEIVGWDGLNWVCTSDNTLTEAEVEAFITNGSIDLAVGTTVGGQDIMTSDDDTLAGLSCLDTEIARYDSVAGEWYCAGDALADLSCNDGEFITYNSSTGGWDCINFQSILDADGDGIMAWADCDDNDNTVGSSAFDGDCDGVFTADDCNDNDPNSNTVAIDADCDGTLTLDDCDDNDSNSTIKADDADCDGVLTADDCDDNDPLQTIEGGSQGCPAQSCNSILTNNPSSADGTYYINPNNLGLREVYCDMTLDDGGWTLVYININPSKLTVSNSGELGNVNNLTSPSGDSAKFSDVYINAIKSHSDSRIGYRISSNDISNRYFVPSSCSYNHNPNSSSDCRKYVAAYTSSTSPTYIQCANWGGGSGGLDAWYQCNGGGYTNVFNTHRSSGYAQSGGITTNSGGNNLGSDGSNYSNDILMWVR